MLYEVPDYSASREKIGGVANASDQYNRVQDVRR